MKSMFLKASILMSFAASFVYAAEKKEEDLAPKYKNRIAVLQSSLSYDRTAEDEIHYGFDSYVAKAWRDINDTTVIGVIEGRIGYTMSSDARMRVTPVVGVSVFKDLEEHKFYTSFNEKNMTNTSSSRVVNPYRVHAMIGVMGEYDVAKSVSVGFNLKGLVGKITGAAEAGYKELSYGMHGALPITFRFGADQHWDLRMEPFALLLRDTARYLGARAAVGYRF